MKIMVALRFYQYVAPMELKIGLDSQAIDMALLAELGRRFIGASNNFTPV
jgi:hypothetical protein